MPFKCFKRLHLAHTFAQQNDCTILARHDMGRQLGKRTLRANEEHMKSRCVLRLSLVSNLHHFLPFPSVLL